MVLDVGGRTERCPGGMEAGEEAMVLSCGYIHPERRYQVPSGTEFKSLKSWPEFSTRAQPPSPPGAAWLCSKMAEPAKLPTKPDSAEIHWPTSPLHVQPGRGQAGTQD